VQAAIGTDGLPQLTRGRNRILALTRKAPNVSLSISHPQKGQNLEEDDVVDAAVLSTTQCRYNEPPSASSSWSSASRSYIIPRYDCRPRPQVWR
jgi:hypothetical protein